MYIEMTSLFVCSISRLGGLSAVNPMRTGHPSQAIIKHATVWLTRNLDQQVNESSDLMFYELESHLLCLRYRTSSRSR